MTNFNSLPRTSNLPDEDIYAAAQRAFGDYAGVAWLSSAIDDPGQYRWIGVVHVPDTGIEFAVYQKP